MEATLLSLYLRLFHSDYLPTVQLSRQLKQTGSVREFLSRDDESLLANGLTGIQIQRLRKTGSTANPRRVDEDLAWSEAKGNAIVCFEDVHYPMLLRQIDVPPPVLYVRGQIEALAWPQLAVVGSRKATSYGLRNAYWMAHELSMAGLCITSGMARGIDTRAHQGALDSGNVTIAVIGTGQDSVYPSSNQRLADTIATRGAVVSEFARETPALPGNFPRRNRIMSGLSMGTLVVEAALKSGTLITAKLALEHNREVFAIPGPISSPQSAGCHQLIADGAKLVERPTDILQEFGVEDTSRKQADEEVLASSMRKGEVSQQDNHSSRLTKLIGYQGCELEYLLKASGYEYQTLLRHLLDLEIAGEIQAVGGRYYRT